MKPYYEDASVTIYHGDCREVLSSLPRAIAEVVRAGRLYVWANGEIGDFNVKRSTLAEREDLYDRLERAIAALDSLEALRNMAKTYFEDYPVSRWRRFLCLLAGHRISGEVEQVGHPNYEYCGRCGRYWIDGRNG